MTDQHFIDFIEGGGISIAAGANPDLDQWDVEIASPVAAVLEQTGDLITLDGDTNPARLPTGTDGQLLSSDSTQTMGLGWIDAPIGGDVAADPLWDAKGDLAAGTGPDAAAKLSAGANGQILSADSTTPTGLKWVAAPSGGTSGADTAGWMPLTTVVGGVPDLVWDASNSLIPTYGRF